MSDNKATPQPIQPADNLETRNFGFLDFMAVEPAPEPAPEPTPPEPKTD